MANSNAGITQYWLEHSRASDAGDAVLRRRKAPRFAAADDFVIKVRPAENNRLPEMFVRGYNISAGGLGVLSKWLIPGETPVLIHREPDSGDEPEEPWVPATVVHCTQSPTGFKIGLSFES
jgi:hypothetical protein